MSRALADEYARSLPLGSKQIDIPFRAKVMKERPPACYPCRAYGMEIPMKKLMLAALFAVFALTGTVSHAAAPCCDPAQPCCEEGAPCCED